MLGPLLAYITAQSQDSYAFLKDRGVDPAPLRGPEARLPHAAATRLRQAVGPLTEDLHLGIQVAKGIRPGAFEALSYPVRRVRPWEGPGSDLAVTMGSSTVLQKQNSRSTVTTPVEIMRQHAGSGWLPDP